jgi:hypothetical protein
MGRKWVPFLSGYLQWLSLLNSYSLAAAILLRRPSAFRGHPILGPSFCSGHPLPAAIRLARPSSTSGHPSHRENPSGFLCVSNVQC